MRKTPLTGWRRGLPALAFTLALTLGLAGCGGSVELLSGLHESEANEVIAALAESGIQAGKLPGKEGAVNLSVGSGEVARAIRVLGEQGLPRERRTSMGDVFRKEGLISSPLEERARYLWALSQELAETVSQIDGVVKARVHVVLPERSTGGEPALPSSAAVFVKHRRGWNLEEVVPQVRRLVTASIPGLQAERVSVVLVPVGASATARGETVPGRGAAPASPQAGAPLALWLAGALLVAGLGAALVAALRWRASRAAARAARGGAGAGADGAGEAPARDTDSASA